MILNEKTAFYKVCFDSMQLGIIVFNKHKKIVLANHPSANIFGYNQQEILNNQVDFLFKNTPIFDNFIKNPNSNLFKSTIELIGVKSDGNEIFIELNFGKMEYENELFFKALISDISLRKQKEQKISHLNFQLEEEVRIRNIELEKLIEKLKISLNKEKELNNLKTKFIALASHEFKTPLSAILSSTELMNKYADLENVEKRKEHLEKVKVMIGRLNGMLDDFLTLENIEMGIIKPDFTLFKINELVSYIKQNTTLLLKKNQVLNFKFPADESIYHDKKIINIILSNLLYNAIKYSNESSNIEVKISTNETNIYFSVKDNGIGIPKNEQNLIFNRFFRAKNAMYFPGTGIGLNIVKGYINNLNGNISFKSIENKGTIFKVQLPKINSYEKKGITN
jgi:hypothetical protein